MISVIMPVYNGEKFLKESINSILNQTEQNFELLIVNDGSTDNSEKIILSYEDSRIRYFKKENGGEASARNVALKHSKGKFIVSQDADDISLPNRLEELKRGFISENIGFVHSDMLIINESGSTIGYWQSKQMPKRFTIRFFLKIGTPFNNASIMFRKSIVENLNYDNSLKIGADTEFVSRCAGDWHSIHLNIPLLFYRRHSKSSSSQVEYNIFVKHIKKFLQRYSLEELVPELDWRGSEIFENRLKAKGLIALYLYRRGIFEDAKKILNELITNMSQNENLTSDTTKLVLAFGQMMIGTSKEALNLLMSIKNKDHIVLNFIGEVFAIEAMFDEAYPYFIESIKLNPSYMEPVENLKSIGSAKNFNLVDYTWRKFI